MRTTYSSNLALLALVILALIGPSSLLVLAQETAKSGADGEDVGSSTSTTRANEGGVTDTHKPSPHRMNAGGFTADPSVGACAKSIFDTRVPLLEWFPEENAGKHMQGTAKHPSKFICGTYVDRDSCCTEKTLKDLSDWSDAVDANRAVLNYARQTIDRDPRLMFDQILVAVRTYYPVDIDWRKIRSELRESIGKLIGTGSTALYPPLIELWSAVVTYQEGMLCSACEPHFERFFNGTALRVQRSAADDVANAAVKLIAALDMFLQQERGHIENIAGHVCELQGGGMQCSAVPTVAGLVVNQFTLVALRELFCGNTKGDVSVHDQFCRDFILRDMLRGAVIDLVPLFNNMMNNLAVKCRNIPNSSCQPVEDFRLLLQRAFYTFDERPVPVNIYESDGLNIRAAACDSNLSGYACGGSGPKPDAHHSPPSSFVPIIVTVLILMSVAILVAALFLSRERIKRVTQTWYTRMQDDGIGPTVGLV